MLRRSLLVVSLCSVTAPVFAGEPTTQATTPTTTQPTARAVEADRSTPKAATMAFQRAMMEGDIAAAQAVVLEDPQQQEMAAAAVRFAHALVRAEHAAQQQYGQSLESGGDFKLNLKLPQPDRIHYAEIKTDGEYATVIPPGNPGEQDISYLQKTNDGWRLDLLMSADGQEAVTLQQLQTIADAVEPIAAKLEAGQYQEVDKARLDMMKAFFAGASSKAVWHNDAHSDVQSDVATKTETTQPVDAE